MKEKTFEEKFPSLKGYTKDDWKYGVEKHCVDKQRVREVIEKLFPTHDINDANSIIDNVRLKKELGL